MKIAVLSDTHNNLKNLQKALAMIRDQGIEMIFHCGDLTGVEVAQALAGFHVICVLGNGDVASGEIRQTLLTQNPENYVGLVYSGRIDGARIAASHGHLPGRIEELTHSGEYDYVFKGHSHMHKDEKVGFTRLINPGSLGGLHREDRQFCVLDLESGEANFIKIEP